MKKMTEPTVECVSFEDLLKKDGAFIYTNVGCSMMPLLRERKDIIEIHRKGEERCKKYDVVLYKRKNRYILHRILKVLPDGYIIAGDHCTYIEKDIKDENILGTMVRVQKNGKDITPDNLWYKVYVHLWCDVYPVRMILIRIKQFVYRCLRFLKKRILGR